MVLMTACLSPSRSFPAVTIRAIMTTIRAIMTTKSSRPCNRHNALTFSDTPAEPQISAGRGGASLNPFHPAL